MKEALEELRTKGDMCGYFERQGPTRIGVWRAAAEQGNASARWLLSRCLYQGAGVAEDPAAALSWLRRAAESGLAVAQDDLGDCYYLGDGVEADSSEAFRLYTAAANQGYRGAQVNLGDCYYEGEGVAQDHAEAARHYRIGADAGWARGQDSLGDCYFEGTGVEQDYPQAISWYRQAAEQGFANAQFNLGWCYEYGKGVEKNGSEAANWYRKAAEQGWAEAMVFLGGCYDSGEGVEEDPAEAARWYRQAAELGHPEGQDILGNCYFHGYDVEQDYTQAVGWYRKAAEQGRASAQRTLGWCYEYGKGAKENWAEAAKWYREAAEQGHDEAQFALGYCYEHGRGIERDIAQAKHWYGEAAEQGHKRAVNAHARLLQDVKPPPPPDREPMEKGYWVIAPFFAEDPEKWQRVWDFDLANNVISIGWGDLDDISSLDKQSLRAAIDRTFPDNSANARGMSFRMLWDLFHSIKVGDVILARRGTKRLAAFGTVTRRAYYDPNKPLLAVGPWYTFPYHLDVRWDESPRDKDYPKQVFGLQTLHRVSEEKYRTLVGNVDAIEVPGSASDAERPVRWVLPGGAVLGGSSRASGERSVACRAGAAVLVRGHSDGSLGLTRH
jgi:TPR repeat protein